MTPATIRLQMERQLASLTRLLQEQDFADDEEANAFIQQFMAQGGPDALEPSTPLEEAQELIYRAMEAKGKRRAKLIQEALNRSPDCADAYVLQAEDSANPQEARRLFEEGVRAGERALGDMFATLTKEGAFWGYVESRPYMRASEGLAHTLWALGERQEAIGRLQEMLRLNPNDNQGVRYILISWLLIAGDDMSLKAAEKLLASYDEDGAVWAYSRLLLRLRRKGIAGRAADAALQKAMTSNPFVPFFLLGVLPLPDEPPEFYGIGDENEALIYLEEGGGDAWIQRQGDVIWLAEALIRLMPPEIAQAAQVAQAVTQSPRPRPLRPKRK